MKILVVDDDEISLLVLADRLEELGYQVTSAANGKEAWDLLQKYNFRLIILDWMMPEMDGMELTRLIRATPSALYTYIILLTGRTDRRDRLAALEGGADDFLPKPLDQGELMARLKAADRILRSEDALRQTNLALTEARDNELRTGGIIQKRLLQGIPPRSTSPFTIQSLTIPSQAVDGDFVDFFPFGEDVVDVVAADVMGKGVPAALMGAGVKSTLKGCMISLLGAESPCLPEPKEVMERLDEAVVSELVQLESFLTLCYARFDRKAGTVRYVNAGHPRLLQWQASSRTCILHPPTAVPLGFVDKAEYSQAEFPIEAGDLVLIYSDGVTDLLTSQGERLGMSGFKGWVEPRGHLGISTLLAELQTLHEKAPGPRSARDDFSCLAVRFRGPEIGQMWLQWTDPRSLDRIRRHVRAKAETANIGFSRSELHEIELAVQEASSNAVRHAVRDTDDLPIEVTTSVERDLFTIELRYPDRPFDPAGVPDPILDGSKDGGFGVAIMRRCMESVTYHSESGHNRVVLQKRPSKPTISGRDIFGSG